MPVSSARLVEQEEEKVAMKDSPDNHIDDQTEDMNDMTDHQFQFK